MMSESARWYALYTKSRWEKKVADLLTRKQVENYCPLNKVLRHWSDRKKIVEEPLFRSYVFVRVPQNLQKEIRTVSGVINFVYWLGKPAVVRDHEIELIRRFMNAYQNVKLEKIDIQLGDEVMITAGPLMHREGNVIELRQKSIRVQLSSLGYALVAEVDKSNVEKINFILQEHETLQKDGFSIAR